MRWRRAISARFCAKCWTSRSLNELVSRGAKRRHCDFIHHLGDAALVLFIQWMDSHARSGWFINDLHRHPLPYYFIKTVFHALPFSRMMRSDGPISISRAFVAADWRRLL